MISKGEILNRIDFSEGEVILFDKSQGISSFDVIRDIKKIVRIKKIGHTGTLDPLATGLLILCTGKLTKTVNYYQNLTKTYEGVMKLGGATSSFDSATPINENYNIDYITDKDIINASSKFVGVIDQIPPIYSALKVGGQRAYKLALKGEIIEMKSRKVTIYDFEIIKIDLPEVEFKVKCSKGTYIRSIVHDFGKVLNNGAYLVKLRRTKIGDYTVEDALTLEEFQKNIEEANIEML